MLEWYKDKNLEIYFSELPDISVLYVTPDDTKKEKRKIYKKPFKLENVLDVILKNNEKEKNFEFSIQKNYCWDGATIPRVFWRLVGAKTDPRFLIASLIHDVLCENHSYIDNDRYFATCVFERLLYVAGVCPFKRWLVFHSVDNFQKFCKWSD